MARSCVLQLALVALATVTSTAAATAAATAAETYFEGDGTVYTLGEPSGGNCNFMAFPDDAVTKYAALNTKQWAATRNCGRCAEVSCADARCAGKATRASEIVHIVDQCPGCAMGDLDLSPSVFKAVTGYESDRIRVQWRFVDCPVRSKIKYCLKKGSNPFWAAVQPTNFVAGVARLQVNGHDTTMVDSAYYFLLDGKSETKVDLAKVTITLTSVTGERVEDTVSFAAADCVEGVSQFSSPVQTPVYTQTPASPVQTLAPSALAPTAVSTQMPTTAPSTPPSVVAQTDVEMPPAVTTVPQVTRNDVVSSTAPPVTRSTAAPSTLHVPSALPSTLHVPSASPSLSIAGIASSSSTHEVGGEMDRTTVVGTNSDSITAALVSPAATSAVASPDIAGEADTQSPTRSAPSTATADRTDVAKTETQGSDRRTSPAVIALSVFGCVAAVVLVVLATYVQKKKREDKRADRAGGPSFAINHEPSTAIMRTIGGDARAVSAQTSLRSGSYCVVDMPGTARVELNYAVL